MSVPGRARGSGIVDSAYRDAARTGCYNVIMRAWITAFALLLATPALLPRPALAVLASAVVTAKQPAPQARLRTFYPVISAAIRHAGGAHVHVFLDGNDVTGFIGRQGDRISYVPRERLSAGWHDVFLEGIAEDGRRFNDAWVFQTQAPDGDWDDSGIGAPVFIPVGTTLGVSSIGGFLHFFFIAPADGFAVLNLCNLGTFPFEHFAGSPVFIVTVPFTQLTPFSNCGVTAFFTPLGGGQGQFFPLGIAGPPMSARTGVTPGVRTNIPLYRAVPSAPAGGTTMRSLPASGAQPQMILIPGTRTIPAVGSSVPHTTIPHTTTPRTTIPRTTIPHVPILHP